MTGEPPVDLREYEALVAAIEMAAARRDGDIAGCIFHSDRGSQFRARKVHRALARYGMVGSMGQVGSAGDNAAMESFLALVQKNVLNRRRSWPTRDGSASRSSPGSNGPTTTADARAASAD